MRKYLTISIFLLISCVIGGLIGYKIHTIRDENIAMSYFVEGNKYLKQGKYYEAAKMLNRSIGLSPDFPLSHYALSESYEKLSLYDLMKKEDSYRSGSE